MPSKDENDLSNRTLMRYFRNKEEDSTSKTIRMLIIGSVITLVIGSIGTWAVWNTVQTTKVKYLEKEIVDFKVQVAEDLKKIDGRLVIHDGKITVLKEEYLLTR